MLLNELHFMTVKGIIKYLLGVYKTDKNCENERCFKTLKVVDNAESLI